MKNFFDNIMTWIMQDRATQTLSLVIVWTTIVLLVYFITEAFLSAQ